jgi:lipocalin-like protein
MVGFNSTGSDSRICYYQDGSVTITGFRGAKTRGLAAVVATSSRGAICFMGSLSAGAIMRSIIIAIGLLLVPFAGYAAEQDISGTYRLISSTRKILDTGQVVETFGKNPKGYILYGKDGHFVVVITSDSRPKAEAIDKITDQQRAELFRTLTAYGGTYTFDGSKVEHHIELSWNEVWTGTTVIRDVQRDGDRRLIYTTRPALGGDGKMGVFTLVWEKVE